MKTIRIYTLFILVIIWPMKASSQNYDEGFIINEGFEVAPWISTTEQTYTFTIAREMFVTVHHALANQNNIYAKLTGPGNVNINKQYGHTSTYKAEYVYTRLSPGTYRCTVGYNRSPDDDVAISNYVRTTIIGTFPNTRQPGSLDNPFDFGSVMDDFIFTDTKNTKDYPDCNHTWSYNNAIQRVGDVTHKVTLNTTMDLTISYTGSELQEMYFTLVCGPYDATSYMNIPLSSNREYTMRGLTPDDYFIISEGNNEAGNIVLTIKGSVPNSLSKNQNYIHSIIPLIETASASVLSTDKSQQTVQYFDGLGFPVQTLSRKITPDKRDLVILQEYDGLGRETNTWLPGLSDNDGEYADPAQVMTSARSAQMNNDSKPYSKTVYEPSALNRVTKQIGPGTDWHTTSLTTAKGVTTEYLTNTASGVQACIYFSVTGTGVNTALGKNANYAVGELYVTKVTDEDGNISYEFKDKLGQVVLNRQMAGSEQHDTYYVYDEFGNLCYVLPPRTVDEVTNYADADEKMRQLSYIYKYDNYNRCIKKRLPGTASDTNTGTGWVYYIYDKADQLIFSQDGEQRKKGEWMFTIPDGLGREVLTGICKNTLVVGNEIANVVCATRPTNSVTNTTKGYTLSGITLTTGFTILSVNYYDNYSFLGFNGIPNTTATQYNTESGFDACYGDHQTANKENSRGLLTGNLTAQYLSDGTISGTYLYSVMYYDYRGRVVQTKSGNHLGGNETEYIAYNFTGQPLKRKHIHTATGKAMQTENYVYEYDHGGRLLKTTHQLNGATAIVLAENTYDESGRLLTSMANENTGLKTTYTYNVRFWTKGIINTHFVENLDYNFNGNIKTQEWHQASKTRKYTYEYDPLSRLTRAVYTGDGSFGASYTYDKQGNISTIQRSGNLGSSTYGIIDNLTFTYTGNQMIKVEDTAIDLTIGTSADFRNGSTANIEYSYDTNGNLIQDLNKGISLIEYNSLNLPKKLTFNASKGNIINTYTYAIDGKKLTVNNGSLKTDYAGNVIYENGTFKRLLVDGGYYENGQYYFFIRDHLGSNRIVLNQNGNTISQSVQYYPFGMAFADGSGQALQPYKYNAKELDAANGLNLYDYSARHYDPAVGRFTTIDPLAENYYAVSPYAYCVNNPILYIDPDGKDTYRYDIETGQLIWVSDEGGEEKQFVHFYNKDNVIVNSAYVNGTEVYVYALQDDQFVMTNFDAGLDEDYNSISGYKYSYDDFVMRNELIKDSNPLGKYILRTEREGKANPITRRDAEHTYGSSMLGLLTFTYAMETALGLTDGVNANKYASRGFNLKKSSSIKSREPQSSTNSWNRFMKDHKGKYKGENWRKQAVEDYKKSSYAK